ncbi:uroporphyrinogen-III synthase [Salipaludibacillus sp. CF4.18]|uniref:uroporphyrinogen-III synthase n=1 Tax=Salipaludibacillus sp. CF4.18 TaxID=3373081 RepID=UPI003EE6054A
MKALQGVTVLNTRATHQAASLTEMIEKRGGISIEIPLIAIKEPENFLERNRQLQQVMHCDWLIFTSANSFEFTMNAMIAGNMPFREIIMQRKIAVVGSKTKAAVEKKGFNVDLYPRDFDAEHLAEKLIDHTSKGETFFYPRSNLSRKVLVDKLKLSDRHVSEMVAYETTINKQFQEELNEIIYKKSVDVVILTSPSAVWSFFEQITSENKAYVKETLTIAVIGRVTEEALSRYDVSNILVPKTYTLEAVLALIEKNT